MEIGSGQKIKPTNSNNLTNKDLSAILSLRRLTYQGRKRPDYKYIYKDLTKPGARLSLL